MSTLIISQQLNMAVILDKFEMVFPLGQGIKIYPRRPGDGKKPTFTVNVTREMILDAYSSGAYAIGLYLSKDAKTRFCVIDIDKGSTYHTVEIAEKLITLARAKGIELHLMRSSSSGGWHLVGFFAEMVSNTKVATVLQALAIRAGLSLRSGQCEIYPSPGASRKAVRLPFQLESAWLNPKDGSVILESRSLPTVKRIQDLLAKFDASTTTASQLDKAYNAARQVMCRLGIKRSPKKAAAARVKSTKSIKTSPPISSITPEQRLALGAQYFEQGLSGTGQLNEALFLVGNYLFCTYPERYGYDHADARAAALLTWAKEKHNSLSRTINAGRWTEVEATIHRLAHSPRKWSRNGGEARFARLNSMRKSETQFKLLQAVYTLAREGKSYKDVSKTELAKLAGLTRKTILKHWKLLEELDAIPRHRVWI